MKFPFYNQNGEAVGELELMDAVFAAKGDADVVHQVAVAVENQSRVARAHAKMRGEVRGGGRKPWKQKGTGRARHGSIRSPLWVGGGVTFGPRNTRNFSKRINKKMKLQALRLVLSDKVQDKKLIVLDSLKLPAVKTSSVATLLKNFKLVKKTAVLASDEDSSVLIKSSRNIPGVFATASDQVSVLDLLKHEYVVLSKGAVSLLEKRLA